MKENISSNFSKKELIETFAKTLGATLIRPSLLKFGIQINLEELFQQMKLGYSEDGEELTVHFISVPKYTAALEQ